MTVVVVAFGLLALAAVVFLAWLIWPVGSVKTDIDGTREWAEMQLEHMSRDARARMRQAADDARKQERRRAP